jgi:hypothetical protein
MIKSKIALDSYQELEKILKKFTRVNSKQLAIYDTNNIIGDQKKALQNYLMSCNPDIKITIVDVSSLPKDAKVCLFAYKDEKI